jgi:hypothetical protein
MSIERIIATVPGTALVAGLEWRPPTGGKPSRAALAEARALTDASHFALVQSGSQTVYGLFTLRPSEEGQKLPKTACAAAALFAQRVGREAPNGALVLQLPAVEDSQAKLYLVTLEEGVPTIDMLGTEVDVLRALGDDDRPIWADDPVRFPRAETVDLAWLAGLAGESGDRSARIQRVPVNPWPAVGLTLLVVAGAAGWLAWQQRKHAEEKRLADAAAAAADPVPKYLGALAAQSANMVTSREQLVAVTRHLFELPAFVPGWQLRAVDCGAIAGVATPSCRATWVRRGGGFDELKRALPAQALVIEPGAAGATPSLDQAATRWNVDLGRHAIGASLPTFEAAIDQAGSLLQRWKTADFALDLKPPTLWPVVADVPASFAHPRALKRGLITAKGVPAPLVVEALQAAPAWISWDGVHLDVADLAAGSARSQLKFTLNGTYYVAARN